MTAENIIKTLEHGDATTTDEILLVNFGGHEWHVKAFVGSYPKATLLLEGERSVADPVDIVSTLIRAACVAVATGVKARPAVAKRILSELIASEYDRVVAGLERVARNAAPKN